MSAHTHTLTECLDAVEVRVKQIHMVQKSSKKKVLLNA